MPLLDVAYIRRRSALEIIADLSGGWTRKKKTYGYSEETRIDFPGDYKIRIAVTVLPRPSGFHEAVRTVSPALEATRGDGNVDYELREAKLTVRVQLFEASGRANLQLPWVMTSNNKLAIRLVDDSLARQGPLRLELQLLMVFNPPPAKTPEDIRDWEGKFFPGGLPSLGKKH